MNAQERSRKEYISRINKVMDHVEKNLADVLNLNTIANQAHFSPYHFHRIFTFLAGETPAGFIQRIRLGKAARLLRTHPEMSINDIVRACGFSSLALFSRSFRKYFDITAREFRETDLAVYAKEGFYHSENGKVVGKNKQLPPDFAPPSLRR
ncbi:MAG: helix-turn-helix transcriptional regulator [Prevotellaceae bacterium]|jgi:AraC family transcriptional regulator|nr:helix-turn-helix transcriptional regulator [Prevotellaceae bacterium]